jgi:hypothetical protein
MVQFKVLTTILIATTVILPSLALPVNIQGSEDLVTRDYDDLFERDISLAVEPQFTREFSDDIDLEAREPKVRISAGAKRFFSRVGNGLKKAAGFLFGRELDDTEDLLSRDDSFEDLD